MKPKIYAIAGLFAFLCFAATTQAGISVSNPGVRNRYFTIYYGLGSPAPCKIAYVSVRKPDGYRYTVAQAENVPDYSQTCYVYTDQMGWYRFYYEYSYTCQGVPRTEVFYQDHYVASGNNISWGTISAPSVAPPSTSVAITANFNNSGASNWGGNHYIEFSDGSYTPHYYASLNGIWSGYIGSRTGYVNHPNIGGVGTSTYHLRGIEGGVEYFGPTASVSVVIDYKPTVSLSAPTSVMLDQPAGVNTSAADQYANLTAHALDYKPPGGAWVWGSVQAGTRWEGGPTNASNLSLNIPLNIAGDWEFHTRSFDSYGQLSDPQSRTVNVYIPTPSCTISADATTISSGGTVNITVNATNARYVNVDQTSPNNGYYGSVTTGGNVPPSGAHYDLGAVTPSHPRPLALTLTNNSSTPVAYTFRGAVSAGAAWYYSSNTVTITVNGSSTPPVILAHPQSQSVTVGGTVSFTVSASGTPSPSYQWRKGGANLPGANASSYTISGAQLSHAGTYDVVVSNSAGSVTSNGAVLSVGSTTQNDTNNQNQLNIHIPLQQ